MCDVPNNHQKNNAKCFGLEKHTIYTIVECYCCFVFGKYIECRSCPTLAPDLKLELQVALAFAAPTKIADGSDTEAAAASIELESSAQLPSLGL